MSSTEQKLDWFSHNSSPSFVCLVDQQEVGMDILNLLDYPSDRLKYKQAASDDWMTITMEICKRKLFFSNTLLCICITD